MCTINPCIGSENERIAEEQIEKLTSEIEEIQDAIEKLGRAKEETENKLKDEIKKAREFSTWKTKRIDRNSSKTLEYLNASSSLYDEMFVMHENCELHNKTQDVMEMYKHEFIGLMNLYEKLKIGFLKPTKRRFGCPCQLEPEEYEDYCFNLKKSYECDDKIQYESYLEKKISCSEEQDEEDIEEGSFETVEG